MSLPFVKVGRLSDEADEMLELLTEAQRTEKCHLAADLLERALLGEGHAIRVVAERLSRVRIAGSQRDTP